MEQRTPEEIKELRSENRHQNDRLSKIEERLTEVRITLVGIDNNNGLRGELRDHKVYTQSKLADIEKKVDDLVPSILKGMAAIIGVVSAFVGIVWTVVELFWR